MSRELSAPEPTPDPSSDPDREFPGARLPPTPAGLSAGYGLLAAGGLGAALALTTVGVVWWLGLGSDRITALGDQVAALQHELRALAARPQPTLEAPVSPAQLAVLEARMTAVDDELAGLRRTVDGEAGLGGRLAAVEQRAEALAAREAKASALQVDQNRQVEAGTASVAAVQGQVDAFAPRLASLEQAIAATASRVSELAGGAADPAVRRALATLELRLAVDRGGPFAAELAALQELGPDPKALKPLDLLAATGVPTPAMLARSLQQLQPALLATASPPPPQGQGVLAQLGASAERLVRIRRLDDPPGDEPANLIARAEGKANSGDVAGALAELQKLPDPLQVVAGPWVKMAQTRVAATDKARELTLAALIEVAKPVRP